MTWIDPRTWVAGETVTAAQMNELRDSLKALGDPWAAYSPSWTGQGGNPSIGNGSINGRYMQAGKFVVFSIQITMGTTTTFGSGNYTFTLPVVPENAVRHPIGWALIQDSSAADRRIWFCATIVGSPTEFQVFAAGGTTFQQGNPFTLANNDEINISGTYEAA